MLDAILPSAKKFKQGMRVLESVYSRCCVQLRSDGLVFGVKNEDEGVPVLLTLTERSFRTYLLTEPDFRNAYFDFDLRAFNKILDLYADNQSIAFHIVNDDLETLRFSYVHHAGFEVRLPIYQIECPYFKTIEFNGVRPVQLLLNSRLFERTLQYSLNNQQPITIIEWRSMVMTMCSEDGILQRKYADPETNEVENYFRFHLSLH